MSSNQSGPRITFTRAQAALASGKWSVAVLVLCFLVTALLVPRAAHLPRWIAVELVIAAWWFVWTCGISYLLFATCGLSDDAPHPRVPGWISRLRSGDAMDGCLVGSDLGCIPETSADGCVQVIAILIAGVFLVLGVWLLIELVIPGLAFLMYILIRGMLGRAISGHWDCHGRAVRSALWGTFWATAYTAPLALAIWAAHAFAARGA